MGVSLGVSKMAELSVKHDVSSCVFRLPLDQDECAFLNYRIEQNGVWDCYHTEVPVSRQGQGLGGVLAKVSIKI